MKVSTLSNLFNAAVFGLTGLAIAMNVAVAPTLPETMFPEPPRAEACDLAAQSHLGAVPVLARKLTNDEKGFYTEIFREKVNLNDVCVYLYDTSPQDTLATEVPEGESAIINVYGQQNYSTDYTKEDNPFLFGALAYEITHLMQHQNRTHSNEPDGSVSSAYTTLNSNAALSDYTDAQTREMMSDYARFVFHPTGETAQLKNFTDNACIAQAYFLRTIEVTFPGAEALRENMMTRHLTDDEKALVLGIFGNEISNIDTIQIINHPECDPDDAAATVFGGNRAAFHAWTRAYQSDDYTKSDIFNFGLMPHELTHIWQNQNGVAFRNLDNNKYLYPVDTSIWSFRDYYTEQQGSIIEDYARYFLNHAKDTRNLTETRQNLAGLKQIVEDQFPVARLTREYFETHGKLPDLPTVQSWLSPQASVSPGLSHSIFG